MSDSSALITRLQAGDNTAFDETYRLYRPRIFGFLARLTQNPTLAEDLLQETFIRLAKHAPRLAPDTRLAAWLFTVARNLFISQRRWALLDIGRTSELQMWSQLRGTPETPFAMLAANETERVVEQAIADLPLRGREVVLLVAKEKMSPKEAAVVLGIEPAAVRQRLARARVMIQERLDRHAVS